jgi:hypothetical protein
MDILPGLLLHLISHANNDLGQKHIEGPSINRTLCGAEVKLISGIMIPAMSIAVVYSLNLPRSKQAHVRQSYHIRTQLLPSYTFPVRTLVLY